jgi:hypothetical protein
MMSPHRPSPSWATLAALGLLGWLLGAPEASGQLRIANYNVTASSSSLTSPRPGMDTVLAAIGSSAKGGFSRPIDVLVLLEANTVGTTGVQFATLLNTIYGGTNYRQSALDGGSTGAGSGSRARHTRPFPPRPTGSLQRLARPHRVTAAATVRRSPYVALRSPCPAAAREPGTPALLEACGPESASEVGSGGLPRKSVARSSPRLLMWLAAGSLDSGADQATDIHSL